MDRIRRRMTGVEGYVGRSTRERNYGREQAMDDLDEVPRHKISKTKKSMIEDEELVV